MKRTLIFLTGLLFLLLACQQNGNTTPVDSSEARLTGPDDMVKVLITVELSPTPDASLIEATSTPTPGLPTLTDEPPPPTATPTAYVGVYVGPQSSGTPLPRGGDNFGTVVPGEATQPGSTTNCTTTVAPDFQSIFNNNQLSVSLGCPRDAGSELSLVQQNFERGTMIWRNIREIYAILPDGQYRRISDTWEEGQPDRDPNMVPPANLQQPIRGFGKAWRENGVIQNAIGWATAGEFGFTGTWQSFERGIMFRDGNGRVYALIEGDGASGRYQGPF